MPNMAKASKIRTIERKQKKPDFSQETPPQYGGAKPLLFCNASFLRQITKDYFAARQQGFKMNTKPALEMLTIISGLVMIIYMI